MTLQNHENLNIIKENKAKLKTCNFMIFGLGEPPKWCLQDLQSWLSILSIKAQRESNYHSLRPPQNTEIIKKPTVKQTKIRHLEIIKINRSDDPPKPRNPTFTPLERFTLNFLEGNVIVNNRDIIQACCQDAFVAILRHKIILCSNLDS